jgi:glyoxylase-like metal-dependent hydrolase (beta-lactamase superfamily II)
MKTVVRVNGAGSAWPVMIGDSHPIYSTGKMEDLSNASYSLIGYDGNNIERNNIRWEVMIDMGHHTIPYLINNENRIPEIVALTHGHADHFFGIDWIVQSYYNKYGIKKKYPVYTTKLVWESVLRTFGYLSQIAELHELFPGIKTYVEEIEGLSITAIPVYHGDSATGASMLLFENDLQQIKPVLFTGDVLCPLWRKMDIATLKNSSLLFIDSTNRFPCPSHNHMSFTQKPGNIDNPCSLLDEWLNNISISNLLGPHVNPQSDERIRNYFKEFLADWESHFDLTYNIIDFLRLIPVHDVNLIHYSGNEDKKFYGEPIFGRKELTEWAKIKATEEGLTNITFNYPMVGQLFDLSI